MGPFTRVIFDFAGVLTSNMVEVIAEFEAREGLPDGLYLRAWATSQGQDLYRGWNSARSPRWNGTSSSVLF
jgi:hypothetical protein